MGSVIGNYAPDTAPLFVRAVRDTEQIYDPCAMHCEPSVLNMPFVEVDENGDILGEGSGLLERLKRWLRRR